MGGLLVLFLVGWGAVSTGRAADSGSRPNVVFILADDLGYGSLGCYGQKKIKTPHLDRMASEGLRFTQAYAGCHVCQPSRSVLMTGQHAGRTAIRANNQNQMLLDADVTVQEVLKTRGYKTGLFGKWGLGFEGTTGHPLKQGCDEFFGQLLQVHAHFHYPSWVWKNTEQYFLPENDGRKLNRYVQDDVQKQALDFIRRHKAEPFFAFIGYITPHVELVVPEDSRAAYDGQFPKVEIFDSRPGYLHSKDGYPTYAGMISRMDKQVGEVLALIKELGLDEQTLVIFTSDNGGQGGGGRWHEMVEYFAINQPLKGYKGSWYEGGLRVPFLARWPNHVAAGATSSHPVHFCDVLPTLAEVVGAKAPAHIDGVSFLPTLINEGTQKPREGMYWEYMRDTTSVSQAARLGKWKGIRTKPDDALELYDLDADVSETTNVAAKHPDIVQKLEAYLKAQHTPLRDYPNQNLKLGVSTYHK